MLTDDAFLHAFFSGQLANSDFHHRDHLRLAWLLTRRQGPSDAEATVVEGIRRFAAAHGHAERYHDTMTRFWVRLVAHAVDHRPQITDFDEFLAAHPLLLDKNTPLRHWSREVLFGADARAAWQEPDQVALPFSHQS
jgi:hypothetical protein